MNDVNFRRLPRPAAAAALALLFSCNPQQNDKSPGTMDNSATPAGTPAVTQAAWGAVGGREITQYTVTGAGGMTAKIINYGATVTSLLVKGRDGAAGDVVLGFDSLGGYLRPDNPYFGSIAGRYANRIAGARFELDGRTFRLAANNNGNSLHGGLKGFDKAVWDAAPLASGDGVKFTYHSPDGEEGYPGGLHTVVTYSVTADNALRIEYSATADKATPVNLTHHSYFNLSAGAEPTILRHLLMLRASRYTEVDDALIPTGALPAVKGTAMDFTAPAKVGDGIARVPGGYDHNWALDAPGDLATPAASLYDPSSGRFMEVFTTEPGIQFYAGNFLDGTLPGKGGNTYVKHAGLCLEAQHFPDSPHRPSFPNTILRPGETYRQTTIYKFSVK